MEAPDLKEKEQIAEPADFETAITQTGYGKYNFVLMVVAFTGILGNMFGSTVISYILPAAQCDLNLTTFDKGTLNAVIYGGAISSPLLWGFLSDNLGRQKLLVIGYILEGLCDLASSFSQSLWHLQLFRFFVGFVGCGPAAIHVTYLAEFHAAQHRSRVILLTSFFVSVAFIAVPALAWALLPQSWSWISSDGTFRFRSWNVFLLVCSMPRLLAGFLMIFLPESPKFLISRGQHDEAMKVFQKMYTLNTGKKHNSFPVKELVDELSLNTGTPTSVGASNKSALGALLAGLKQIQPLFSLKYFSVLSLIIVLQTGVMIGINTLRLWIPQIFSIIQEFANNPETKMIESATFCEMYVFKTSQNYSDAESISAVEECTVYVADSWIYINSIIIGASCGISIVIAGFLINALGKKLLIIPCFLGTGLTTLGMFWSRNADVTLTLLSLMHGFAEVIIACLQSVSVDIFPTTLRAMALNVIMLFARLGSVTGNLVFPVLLDINCNSGFFLISGILIVCAVAGFLLPNTKMKALE